MQTKERQSYLKTIFIDDTVSLTIDLHLLLLIRAKKALHSTNFGLKIHALFVYHRISLLERQMFMLQPSLNGTVSISNVKRQRLLRAFGRDKITQLASCERNSGLSCIKRVIIASQSLTKVSNLTIWMKGSPRSPADFTFAGFEYH